jgi:hypothetical protein
MIFPKRPLGLEVIAKRWVRELQGTVHEQTLDEVLMCLLFAVAYDELVPTDPQMQATAQEGLEKIRDRHNAGDDVTFHLEEMLEIADPVFITRGEYFRWIEAEDVQPRPTFWPGADTAAEATANMPARVSTSTRHSKLDAFLRKRIAEEKPLAKGRHLYDAARDECGGWKDKTSRLPEQYFDNRTIGRRIDAVLESQVKQDKLDN